ncbi:MAG TPA: hypothetical protein VIX63_14230 [Vicinamibacterales bacterium]
MAPIATPDTTTYLLRDIDADLWARFKARSEEDGMAMRTLILRLVAAYADDEIDLPARKSRRRSR